VSVFGDEDVILDADAAYVAETGELAPVQVFSKGAVSSGSLRMAGT
jgi:hypothetical protein